MHKPLPPTCPPGHPARLMAGGAVLFKGRARHLCQRLEALKAVAAARVPSTLFQDVDATAPNYVPGLSRMVQK